MFLSKPREVYNHKRSRTVAAQMQRDTRDLSSHLKFRYNYIMSIELLSYNSAIAFGAGPAAENFRIDPIYGAKQPERFLTPIEITSERNALLQKPPCRRTFLVGSFK